MRRLPALATVLLAAIALAAAVLLPSAATARDGTGANRAAPAADATTGEVTLSVDSLSPEVITSGQDLTITGTVTNGTDEAVQDATVVVDVQASTEVTSTALSSWLTGARDTRALTVATQDLGTTVAPGTTATFSVTVPADGLPFSDPDQWGPRGVQVTLTSGGASTASHRSLVVWSDATTVDPTRVTVVVPVTASTEELALVTGPTAPAGGTAPSASATPTAADGSGTPEEGLEALRERVSGLLALAGDGVVLAVDPALIEALGIDLDSSTGSQDEDPGATPGATASSGATSSPSETSGTDVSGVTGTPQATGSARATGSDETPATPAATPSNTSGAEDGTDEDEPDDVTALRATLRDALATGDVIALPWRDADVAALAHVGRSDLVSSAYERSAQATTLAAARTDVAWAASDTLDSDTLDALPGTTSLVIAPTGTMDVTESLTYTPSGVATVGSRTVLLPDQVLSQALGGTVDAKDPDTGDTTTVTLSDLDSRQLLRARTAIITREMPNQGRDVVVTLDRAAAASLTPAEVSERLDALLRTSWTTGSDLAALTSGPTQDLERQELPSSEVESDEVSRADLDRSSQVTSHLDAVGGVLTDVPAVLGDVDDLDLVVASSAWRTDPDGRGSFLDATQARAQVVVGALTAAPSSTINVINSEAHVPVTLVNRLDQDVTVLVHLEPSSTRLQAPEDVSVTVPAHADAAVSVPVTAVGSGDVDVEVQILATDGSTVVGTPSTVHMRVRADWETVGTTVVGAVLAVMLVAGIIRTVRRGRRTAATGTSRTS